jgi:hypothetical protein
LLVWYVVRGDRTNFAIGILVTAHLEHFNRRDEERDSATSSHCGEISEMTFTEQELAFLRRFCWELGYKADGSRPTEDQCPGHFNDLTDLADASKVVLDVLAHYGQGEMTDPAPPEVPFPWESLDHLARRAKEVSKFRVL